MRGLLLFLTLTGALQAAPAPRKEPLKEPLPGRVTVAELHRITVCVYAGTAWDIGFQPDGTYWCSKLVDGKGSLWHGTWRLEGQTIVLDEACSYVSPDSPPGPGSREPARLEMRRDAAGGICGTSEGASWGNDFRLIEGVK